VYEGVTLVGASTAVVVADSVYDTLQTDARWTKDSTGYNFADAIGQAFFPIGDTEYRVEYLFTPTTGATYHWVRKVYAKALVRS
jgi:hypothetical protein